ncbi:NHLP-related RiPP peptide [Lysobacter sp. CFH 32150]|uniref:NHLP-related RiPP peptide n=1 Tax=Lysobacter sp. CFH 32150 TaxID=2927128 RepID=UPI001FA7BAB1|nr:NHLP-related RiPP peptide [Lysobacter sp. CFH 32150]MCI4569071.1 NHLP-related RiPP peptide [Lysobacter sp. CFH 32150]
MATKKGPKPAPLDPKVTKKLLDLLSTDNEFRRLFKKDAGAALAKAGYKVAADATSARGCMQLQATDRIAPKEKIVRDRAKLEQALNSVVNFECTKAFSAD